MTCHTPRRERSPAAVRGLLSLSALLAVAFCATTALTQPADSAAALREAAEASKREPRAMESVTIADELFNLELAVTPGEHQVGLMFRRSISPDGGMLFVFPKEEIRQFWMAYCLVDLDLIFLDASGKIVALHEMPHEPERSFGEFEARYFDRLPRYGSNKPAMFAIELKAGSLSFLHLKVGDTIALDLDRLGSLVK